MSAFRFVLSIGLFAIVLCPPRSSAEESKEATPTTDKFATVYGVKIRYVEAGSGAPVILIHGLADNIAVWDSVIPVLAARFRVIAFDQVGFGHSDKPLLSYRVSASSIFSMAL
jgi:2-hydroxy-6-oxonona-2,4-dienedioate hydrolase